MTSTRLTISAVFGAATLVLAAAPAVVSAQAPQGGPPAYSGEGGSTATAPSGSTVSDGPQTTAPAESQAPAPAPAPGAVPPAGAAPAPAPAATPPATARKPQRLRTTCRTARRTRTRTCRTYRGKTLTRICTRKAGQRRQHCRRISSASAASRTRIVRTLAVERRGAAKGKARASRYLNRGWVNPTAPGVVRLYSTSSTGPDRGWCSGALIARGLVLTAAHCVYNTGEQGGNVGWYPYRDGALQVVPGNKVVNGTNTFPYGAWNVAEVYAPGAYTRPTGQSDDTLDYALVQLLPDSTGRYAGDYTGQFGATWSKAIDTNTELWSAGYPASGVFGQASYNHGQNQYFCNATPDTIGRVGAGFVLQYPCTGTGGISGGPVWARDASGWTIVGVHNRGSRQGDSSLYYGKDAYNYWFDDRFGAFWNAAITAIRSQG